ncbi:hypothetical protein AB0F36_32775 [Streptomyces sp. NPDC029080]|uniref:hypothetical protein n=1 Tax=Streptomyces sp. NPDC029080 TaxID=3155017 RepID=UPI003409164E
MSVAVGLAAGLVVGLSVPAGAAPVTGGAVVAEKCSAAVDNYSSDKWSAVTHKVCASVLKKPDGSLVVQGRWIGDMTYYWGAAWYTEKCVDKAFEQCFIGGELRLKKAGEAGAAQTDLHPIGRKVVGTGHVEATTEWLVKAGQTYRIDLYKGRKEGGYWRKSDYESSKVTLKAVSVDVTVP